MYEPFTTEGSFHHSVVPLPLGGRIFTVGATVVAANALCFGVCTVIIKVKK